MATASGTRTAAISTAASIYPGAEEIPDDGLDNNCNEAIDGVLALDDADYLFMGAASGDQLGDYGRGVSSAGDVDGDGLGDILLGAWGNDHSVSGAGAAYLFFASSLDGDLDVSGADYVIRGENENDLVGNGVSAAGDVDGDGLGDFLVGAWQNDDAGTDAGKACLFLAASLGTDTDLVLSDADYCFLGENDEDYVGWGLSGAGDVDGDGLDDLLIGANGNDDVDPTSGKAYLVLAASLGSDTQISLADADYSFLGESTSDNAGYSVSEAGDVDGDGLADILIGAYLHDTGGANAGMVYLVLGASLGSDTEIDLGDADYAFVGEDSSNYTGQSIDSAGDIDGDGLDDILIGGPRNSDMGTYAGKVYIVLGSSLGSDPEIDLADADYAFLGESGDDQAGYSVAGLGDVDGDGLSDILIGAPWKSNIGIWDGKAYLVYGSSMTLGTQYLEDADIIYEGNANFQKVGTTVSRVGDVDGDGLDDALIAGPGAADNGHSSGTVYLLLECLP
jgi:hypothetical protein